MSLLVFLIVGIVAGWLAGLLVKGGGFGLLGDLVVGVIGAFVGGYIFNSLGVSSGGGLIGSIVVATIGAIVLLVLIRFIKRA
ncbi:MAG: GlsB/YeaQ/YmgE family stress response membrane protein [Gammaproteobacteria bacterium]|uniref:GlsB/YeaQ/YmgE family stress response membrane protein n=1 Tax=Limnobacter sp. TaxID=2003368 RepID=UPI001DB8CC6B|nr:GlsB/YeaQ/YmgE family stress response membrane protein [Limnobacter sp.]MBU0784709.1 GlsB/YeaQ/YmgE family stress response membrane protein [Gammaproteobacteria bacterium]MBU0848094.1 GlsB/YeaQ/YmgE family stress response membrane protein [Gammaproteobacteria bacterium]MBU1267633.1 GlsB/YeaQ/YmgE family stress response membrane protein [Gammaproteobacteria bacterium]MBU1529994.1 GlsB/YeaQ/YmgE family stress response membrane protein [Gammaproteobacteria bacterium]MBU1779869.1 GlsB/YeaQ/YmgE